MEATSYVKQFFGKVGIFLGAVSFLALLPIIWTLGAISENSSTGLSSVEHYTRFMVSHPYILLVIAACIIWMLIALNSKEKK